jgi:hypothetical protein
MAKLWLVYREGLRLLGAPIAEAPLEAAVARIDIAPWRLFTVEPPEKVPAERAEQAPERKRALLEVSPTDRYELCGLIVGFYESPYSAAECLRRLRASGDDTRARPPAA